MTRILIVEDDLDMAENLRDILEGVGVRAEIAPSAEGALQLLEGEPYDGVISDFRLPGKNGVELLAEIRHRGSRLPVILISGYMDYRASEAAEEAGALDILQKPLNLERLLADIAQFSRSERLVLVVDDNEELAENIAEALRRENQQVVVARSVGEALERRDLPNAAILDLRLPDGTGVDVARRLAARNPSIRIIFMSGFLDEHRDGIARLAAIFGPDFRVTCLSKPFGMDRLAEQLEAAAGDE